MPMPLLLVLMMPLQADEAERPDAQEQIADLTQQLVDGHSQRGDLMFAAGRFDEAVADYSAMVRLAPATDRSHWRKGIAHFYAKEYKEAAAQFQRYHSFDNVDRENGIWRYFSQYRALGKQKAREELLRYEKDDREPFGDLYQLFAGKLTGETILNRIEKADVSDNERAKRSFYAQLYIGLNHAVEGKTKLAIAHLRKAKESTWPQSAGYGPRYMWVVGVNHLAILESAKTDAE